MKEQTGRTDLILVSSQSSSTCATEWGGVVLHSGLQLADFRSSTHSFFMTDVLFVGGGVRISDNLRSNPTFLKGIIRFSDGIRHHCSPFQQLQQQLFLKVSTGRSLVD